MTIPFLVGIHGSNPVKLQGAKVLEDISPCRVLNVEADFEFPSQPWGYGQTEEGAQLRAKAVLDKVKWASFGVGIESGLIDAGERLNVFSSCYILSSSGDSGAAQSATFQLPPDLAQMVREGYTLGKAIDRTLNRRNVKQQEGTVGVLTHNLITRTHLYRDLVTLAYTPFMNPDLYNIEPRKKW